MRYEEIEAYLSSEEINALDILEGSGWEILTETKIEDTHKKDGGRIRTFALSGRYDIVVVCRNVQDLFSLEEDAEPDIEAELEIEEEKKKRKQNRKKN